MYLDYAESSEHFDGMRYLYGESDEKYVKKDEEKKAKPLRSYQFSLNPIIEGKTPVKEFDKSDVPIVFKCSPDTLLNKCLEIIDAMPLPKIYTWTIEDICKWLRECDYRQYQNTFRVNLINGRTLLLLDASALSAMNIKDFDHIKDIAGRIRNLFYFEMTKFGRSLTLYPEFHYELFKIFRIKTGAKYNVRRSDLWRKMQLIRQKEPNYSHWDILERWLGFEKGPKCSELFGDIRRSRLQAPIDDLPKDRVAKTCLTPCTCHDDDFSHRPPWRFECLPHLKPDAEFVEVCHSCVPPCTCRWSSKKFYTRSVLSCLKKAFPNKYGGVQNLIRYRAYDQMSRLSYLK